MSFLQSAINQVGRDLGKVTSNIIFKDAHSTPIRSVGGEFSVELKKQKNVTKTEFDKAISFTLGYRPSTLVNKLAGSYTVLKNEANRFVEDEYLDPKETVELVNMMIEFQKKSSDIVDILELDEEKNSNEL